MEARDDKSEREAEESRSNLKSKAEAEGVFIRKLAGAVALVQRHSPIKRGTVMRLILHRLSLLELVPLVTGGWRVEEPEAVRNRAQE